MCESCALRLRLLVHKIATADPDPPPIHSKTSRRRTREHPLLLKSSSSWILRRSLPLSPQLQTQPLAPSSRGAHVPLVRPLKGPRGDRDGERRRHQVVQAQAPRKSSLSFRLEKRRRTDRSPLCLQRPGMSAEDGTVLNFVVRILLEYGYVLFLLPLEVTLADCVVTLEQIPS